MSVNRQENWMSQHLSATYKLTLYAVKPALFSESQLGRLKNDEALLGKEAIIIAESGMTTGYSIDNLMLTGATAGTSGNKYTMFSGAQFDLYEPFGNYLAERLAYIGLSFGFLNAQAAPLALKIEFHGYDVGSHAIAHNRPGPFIMGLKIADIHATCGVEGTTYNFVCSTHQKIALNSSSVPVDLSFDSAPTVKDWLSQFQNKLNAYEREQRPSGEPLRKWKLDASKLPSNLINATMTNASDKAHAAEGTTLNDVTKLTHTFESVQDVNTYILDTLRTQVPAYQEMVSKQYNSTSSAVTDQATVEPGYELRTGIDNATQEEMFDLTYVITLTETKNIPASSTDEQVARLRNKGIWRSMDIRKIYEYMFTGRNTEVLGLEMKMNNIFRQPLYPTSYAPQNQTIVQVENNKRNKESLTVKNNDGSMLAYPFLNKGQLKLVTTLAAVQTASAQSGKYLEDIDVSSDIDFIIRTSQVKREVEPVPLRVQTDINKFSYDNYDHVATAHYRNFITDMQTITLNIVGDPYWLGLPGVYTDSVSVRDELKRGAKNGDAEILLLNYRVKEDVAKPDLPKVPEIDVVTSGVYTVTKVTVRMQGGQFTCDLEATKNVNINMLHVIEDLNLIR